MGQGQLRRMSDQIENVFNQKVESGSRSVRDGSVVVQQASLGFHGVGGACASPRRPFPGSSSYTSCS